MSRFVYRLLGAAWLDRSVYEEIESDWSALPQALATVLLSSLPRASGPAGWHGPTIATMATSPGWHSSRGPPGPG